MTGSELIQHVREILDEPSEQVISDGDIVRKANLSLGQLRPYIISSGSSWYDKDSIIYTAYGKSEYDLPDDFSLLRSLILSIGFLFTPGLYSGKGGLKLKEYRFDSGITDDMYGIPSMYQIRSKTIKLFPTPDSNYKLKLMYARKHTPIDENNLDVDIDIPEEATSLLILSTAIKVAIEAGYDTTELQLAYREAEREVHAGIQDRNSEGILKYRRL